MTGIVDRPAPDARASRISADAVRDAAVAARACASFLALVSDDGSSLELAAVEAIPRELVRAYRRTPLSMQLPCTYAVCSDEPVLLESNDQIGRRNAGLAHLLRDVGDGLAVLPLRLDRLVIGALALSFPERRRFDDRDFAFLGLLGDFCAQAVGRARFAQSLDLVEAERDQLRAVLDGFDAAVVAVSSDLRVELANAAAARMLGAGALRRGDPLPEASREPSLTRCMRSLLSSESTLPRREIVSIGGRPMEMIGVRLPESSSALIVVGAAEGQSAMSSQECSVGERVASALGVPLVALTSSCTLLERLYQALVADATIHSPGAPAASYPPPGLPATSGRTWVGGIHINMLGHEVAVDGGPVHLTPSEFKLLALLAQEPERLFTRQEIIEHLWQSEYIGDGHACDTHISNLRRKIEPDPCHPRRLVSVRGMGYKLLPV